MDATRHFELIARGPYSLAASRRFLEGFAPAALEPGESEHTHWAFAGDDGVSTVGVCLQPRPNGVAVEVFGDDDPGVRDQIARVLSLDIDASGFLAVGERDPVVARIQERYPGLRPVLFFSPWEAASWAAMSHRIRISQAAAIKARMTRETGTEVVVHGESRWAFPSPARVLETAILPGLPERKAANVRAIAEAALDGALDAVRLRSLPPEEALAELKALPGIGDFYAELILIRAVGSPDFLPSVEARVARAVALAYDTDAPTGAELEELAEAWRPFRSWVAFLLRVALADAAPPPP